MAPGNRFRFTFDPAKRGLRKVLGDLEAEIMEVMWRRSDLTVRDVYDRVAPKRDLAYTTVMTVMSRLAAKGLLVQKREGAAYLYSAAVSRDDFARETVQRVVDELLTDFAAPTMSHFVKSVGDEGRIDELEKMIREAKKDRARRR